MVDDQDPKGPISNDDERRAIFQAHDKLFKFTFRNPKLAAVELRAVLPEAIARHIDFTSLELQSSSFIDNEFVEAFSDILYRVRIGDRDAFLYLLFEHQSTVDKLMLLRLAEYILRVLRALVRDHNIKEPPLPVVLPLLLHHSATGWHLPADFHSLFDTAQLDLLGLRQYVPQFTFLLDDISSASEEALRSRASSDVALSEAVALMLLAMQGSAKSAAFPDVAARWQDLIRALIRTPEGRAAFRAILRYCMSVYTVTQHQVITVAANAAPEAKEEAMSLAQELHAEGRAEGEARVLLKLLTLKFGEPLPDVLGRIQSATEDDILRWTERILDADSLDDLFA